MRRLMVLVLVLAVLVPPAFAWQFVTVASGSSPAAIPLFSASRIAQSGGAASSVQIKNTGSGTLTVSYWQYTGSAWKSVHPLAAKTAGEDFYAISDSVVTLAPDESFGVLDEPGSRSVDLVYVNPTATSYKVSYK